MSVWQVQAARIVLFPLIGTGTPQATALELYRTITGKDPDNFQNQTIPGSPFPSSAAQGAIGGLTFACQAQPVRVDFTFSPPSNQAQIVNTMPVFENAQTLHDEMVRLIPSIAATVSNSKMIFPRKNGQG